jgi:hypothetical protein
MRHQSRQVPVLLGTTFLLALLSACGSGEESDASNAQAGSTLDETMPQEEAMRIALQHRDSISLSSLVADDLALIEDDDPLAWRSNGFRQYFTAKNFNALVVTDVALLDDGSKDSIVHQKSAGFSLMRVAPFRLDDYALFGIARDGDLVVARWQLIAQANSVVVSGTGSGVTNGQLSPKGFHRKRLHKGLAGHLPMGIEAEPEGRYVILVDQAPDGEVFVRHLSLADGSLPTTVATSQTVPELSTMQYMNKYDHAQLGRIYVLDSSIEVGQRVMFVDSDFDGVLDGSPIAGDHQFFEVNGLANFEDFTELDR